MSDAMKRLKENEAKFTEELAELEHEGHFEWHQVRQLILKHAEDLTAFDIRPKDTEFYLTTLLEKEMGEACFGDDRAA